MELGLGLAGIDELVEKKGDPEIAKELIYTGERMGYWVESLGTVAGVLGAGLVELEETIG